jgi:microsomal dipeptidase-like Zn-dependent dipeptidase
MFVPGSKFKFYEPDYLNAVIDAGTVDRTILGSDLGQVGNPRPVAGFRNVIETCLDLGFSEADIHKMVSANACQLMGLD